ncbi:uncharacterized protein [Solanum lycopersicum]|uniref:uncharacterized protein n=1 Tax=Solanum lycopersicum TaxID=4081 RepID=UPI00374A0B8F
MGQAGDHAHPRSNPQGTPAAEPLKRNMFYAFKVQRSRRSPLMWSQSGKVISYMSRQPKVHEKNYPTHDLIFVVVVFPLKMWRHYLYGVHVDVFSDHMSLDMSMDSTTHVEDEKKELVKVVHKLTRLVEVKKGKNIDRVLMELKKSVLTKMNESFDFEGDDILRYQDRLCVPDADEMRTRIVVEAHGSRYSIHPGSTKKYHHLKHIYWWDVMKKDIAECVAKLPNCQQVNAEHLKLGGLN